MRATFFAAFGLVEGVPDVSFQTFAAPLVVSSCAGFGVDAANESLVAGTGALFILVAEFIEGTVGVFVARGFTGHGRYLKTINYLSSKPYPDQEHYRL